jgi:peptidoglycan/LPS O-acetylase OafA/YrhL
MILSDGVLRPITSRLKWLGEISYAAHLLHFPTQIFLVLVVASVVNEEHMIEPFASAWMLVGYLAILVALSLATYQYIEVPARKAWRNNLLGERAVGRWERLGMVSQHLLRRLLTSTTC